MAEITTLASDLSGERDSLTDPVKAYHWRPPGVEEDQRIDLTRSEYEKWQEVNAPYVRASRPAPKDTTRRRNGGSRDTEGSRAKAWAREHGHDEMSSRGPCPDYVLQAFRADDPTMLNKPADA